ncbi:hypothetical protein [Glycomyces tenuis]|uniref:hypothetical protein n=1 Tax=Glycomyces tenuis TaxID=58116 RepID=UPI00040FAB17|nr:hypothetical protein [Glycomyces tenuis]
MAEAPATRPGPPRHWGTGHADERRPCPGERFAPEPAERWFRAVTIDAPVETVWRWICQMRVAPYSYDLVDNRGRRSPRSLTPGADRLEIGQEFMTIFTLVDFQPNVHLTLKMTAPRALRLFGPFVVVYDVEPVDRGRTRLRATLLVGDGNEGGAVDAVRRRALAWGDLVMMRKQLRTFKSLAEGGS